MSQDTAATLLNVARTSVQRARTVIDKGTDELKHAVDQGHIAVSVAAKAAELPEASVYIRARKAVATPQAPRKQARLTHPLAQR
jgi:hypothetical protein